MKEIVRVSSSNLKLPKSGQTTGMELIRLLVMCQPLLCFILFIAPALAADKKSSVNVVLYWTGGKDNCTFCPKSNMVYGYACSNGQGNWDSGLKSFKDVIPSHNILQRVDITLYGRFHCQPLQALPNVYTSLAGETIFESSQLPAIPSGCHCGNCAVGASYNRSFTEGWPGYKYGEENIFRVIVNPNAICLHAVNMTLHYIPDTGTTDGFVDYLGWIIAGGAIFIFVLIVLGIIVWVKRKKYMLYEQIISDETLNIDGFTSLFEEIDPGDLIVGVRIGKGSFAEVFKALWHGTEVAVKKLPAHSLTDDFYADLEREAELMQTLRHPNVLQFLGACMIAPDICIVMEFMPRGSLYKILHDNNIDLPWPLRKRMAVDAAKGMNYLHCSDPPILHRDLKSHNLLVDEHWKVKVCDFGLSRIFEQTLSATMTSCGTPCWTAPEVLRGQHYTEKADVYSFGIVLWEMVTREDPFKGMQPFRVVFAVGQQKLRPTMPADCPVEWRQLILDTWQEEHTERLSFAEAIKRLGTFTYED
eukprot:TRINITY_DN7711_c0_g1_i1.p1 TRINITY_DN7711_c0_g1~~TRINITY_DN7711_c0_g1_i1.p1  ORF type:complete len:530 (+),score=70.55 TRINITY_DN7711_c0_g1_i1:14-1603(+)